MWTAANYLLMSYILMAVFAPISLIANGFILSVILTKATLRKDSGLYLLIALSIADFLLALFILPYIVYLLHGWRKRFLLYCAMKSIENIQGENHKRWTSLRCL